MLDSSDSSFCTVLPRIPSDLGRRLGAPDDSRERNCLILMYPVGSMTAALTACLALGWALLAEAIPTAVWTPLYTRQGDGLAISNATSIDALSNSTSSPGGVSGTDARAVATILSLASSILVTATYATLIGPGSRLLSTSKIPFDMIRSNTGRLLSAAWPDTTLPPATAKPDTAGDAIRLFYAGKLDGEKNTAARGVEQTVGVPTADSTVTAPSMWLTTGSSLTKSMVQLSVWEWASTWVALSMLFSTLAFNGFFTDTRGPDSYPRLVVTLIYGVAYCVHAVYVWKVSTSFFTLVAAGSSWSLLHKASFVSVDSASLAGRYSGGASPVFRQVGKPGSSDSFPVHPACLLQDVGRVDPVKVDELSDTQKSEAGTVAAWQKRDVTLCVDAGKLALDRTVTNVMTMLGVTISTGFSAWTTRTVENSQLGSMALLASLTLGVGAMFGSAVELSVMDASFRNVLFLKEVMINGEASAHVLKSASKRRTLGFLHGTVDMKRVGVRDLMKMCHLGGFLLFGPAYALLPTAADHRRQSADAKFKFSVNVRGKTVAFTTLPTSLRSDKVAGDGSVNVCYLQKE